MKYLQIYKNSVLSKMNKYPLKLYKFMTACKAFQILLFFPKQGLQYITIVMDCSALILFLLLKQL